MGGHAAELYGTTPIPGGDGPVRPGKEKPTARTAPTATATTIALSRRTASKTGSRDGLQAGTVIPVQQQVRTR